MKTRRKDELVVFPLHVCDNSSENFPNDVYVSCVETKRDTETRLAVDVVMVCAGDPFWF